MKFARRKSTEGDEAAAWSAPSIAFDDPLRWTVPIGTWAGTRWRLHLILVLFVGIEILRRLPAPRVGDLQPIGAGYAALTMAALCVVIILREWIRAIVARRLRAPFREITLWPLGRLESVGGPDGWRGAFLVAAAGPLTGMVLFVLGAPLLGLLTGVWWTVAIPSPLALPAVGDLAVEGRQPFWLLAIGVFHRVNFLVLMLTVLPLEPLDGSAIVRAAVRSKAGPARAAIFVGRLGMFAAVPVAAIGIMLGLWWVVVVAVIGGAIGFKRVRDEVWIAEQTLPSGAESASSGPLEGAVPADDALEAEEIDIDPIPEVPDEDAALDRVLAKISTAGMHALTPEERGILQRGTARRRGDIDPAGD